MNKRPPRDHPEIVIEESGDENADWLKHLQGGKLQEQDLTAHDDALELERKRDEEDRKS